jgi:preprotein translocase subunit SecE
MELERPEERKRRAFVGTVELIATAIVVLAIVAFLVWFLFFAHDPLLRV